MVALARTGIFMEAKKRGRHAFYRGDFRIKKIQGNATWVFLFFPVRVKPQYESNV
jgi:hypothetical protein